MLLPGVLGRTGSWRVLPRSLRSLLGDRRELAEEAQLYYRRACLATSEERYDVAAVFCAKALEIDPRHLAARLLQAQIQEWGFADFEEALKGYLKVIALAGYDVSNPYCAAAREAVDALVSSEAAP